MYVYNGLYGYVQMKLRTRCLECGTETTVDWGPYVPWACAFYWQMCSECEGRDLKYCFECGSECGGTQIQRD